MFASGERAYIDGLLYGYFGVVSKRINQLLDSASSEDLCYVKGFLWGYFRRRTATKSLEVIGNELEAYFQEK